MEHNSDGPDLNRHYYLDLAAAYVRGSLSERPEANAEILFRLGLDAGLRLHRFKRTNDLPRVRKVIGILHGLAPSELLDIGSGRGVFLWPLLDAFPGLPVTALDHLAHRIADLELVRSGGIARLNPLIGDVTKLEYADRSFDAATILEVLEHLPQPELGARELLRVTRRFVVATVPSKPDDNPEHIHLFTNQTIQELFEAAADAINRSVKVRCEYVLNHIVAVVALQL